MCEPLWCEHGVEFGFEGEEEDCVEEQGGEEGDGPGEAEEGGDGAADC